MRPSAGLLVVARRWLRRQVSNRWYERNESRKQEVAVRQAAALAAKAQKLAAAQLTSLRTTAGAAAKPAVHGRTAVDDDEIEMASEEDNIGHLAT